MYTAFPCTAPNNGSRSYDRLCCSRFLDRDKSNPDRISMCYNRVPTVDCRCTDKHNHLEHWDRLSRDVDTDWNNTVRWSHHRSDPCNPVDNDIPSDRCCSRNTIHHWDKVQHNIDWHDRAIEVDNFFRRNLVDNGRSNRPFHCVAHIDLDWDTAIVNNYSTGRNDRQTVDRLCRSPTCIRPYKRNVVQQSRSNPTRDHNRSVGHRRCEMNCTDWWLERFLLTRETDRALTCFRLDYLDNSFPYELDHRHICSWHHWCDSTCCFWRTNPTTVNVRRAEQTYPMHGWERQGSFFSHWLPMRFAEHWQTNRLPFLVQVPPM